MIKQILFDCGSVFAQMKFKDTMLKISGSEEIADYFIKNIWREGSRGFATTKGNWAHLRFLQN